MTVVGQLLTKADSDVHAPAYSPILHELPGCRGSACRTRNHRVVRNYSAVVREVRPRLGPAVEAPTNPCRATDRLGDHEVVPVRVATYIADFSYFNVETHSVVVEDVKSKAIRTALYRLKKKLIEAQHEITITEV